MNIHIARVCQRAFVYDVWRAASRHMHANMLNLEGGGHQSWCHFDKETRLAPLAPTQALALLSFHFTVSESGALSETAKCKSSHAKILSSNSPNLNPDPNLFIRF